MLLMVAPQILLLLLPLRAMVFQVEEPLPNLQEGKLEH